MPIFVERRLFLTGASAFILLPDAAWAETTLTDPAEIQAHVDG